jgi:predicted DNA-binding transcriptional regulator AlpA
MDTGIARAARAADLSARPVGQNDDALLAEYLTRAQLAAQLGVSERTIDRWHTCRTGPPRTVFGRQILYRRSSVRDWLAKRERGFDDDRERRSPGRRRR